MKLWNKKPHVTKIMTLISVTWNVNSLIMTWSNQYEPGMLVSVELRIKMLKSLILHIFFNFYKPQQKIHINLFVMKYSGLATLDQGWKLLKVVRPDV